MIKNITRLFIRDLCWLAWVSREDGVYREMILVTYLYLTVEEIGETLVSFTDWKYDYRG